MHSQPPAIAPLPAGSRRPFWSVMIPTYRPGHFLRETIRCLLAQDPGPEEMQIEVVDDCSPDHPARDLIDSVTAKRVTLHRNPHNLGLAGNWNECIRRARGQMVHLLHQDDRVLPGFYERLRKGLEQAPDAVAAFCRFGYANEESERTWTAPAERVPAGRLDRWLERIASKCRMQCAAMVVRRSTYERVGGYHPELQYALDWEMWVRIAALGSVWYEPEVLAEYRIHAGSETSRLSKAGGLLLDQLRAIELFSAHLPDGERGDLVKRARHESARLALRQARQALEASEWSLAMKLADQAVTADPGFATRRRALRLKANLRITRFWRSMRG